MLNVDSFRGGRKIIKQNIMKKVRFVQKDTSGFD